jgi:2-polyprenyl-3-methyl-5-hydroxy-6-metoxy-1,4-benzoquinol methylase
MNDDLINVRDLIAKYSHEEHALRADDYFHHVDQSALGFTKPFSSPVIAEDMLPKVHAMLHAAALYPGARVLDFGAGVGWLSRALASMGCESVALDVSAKALELAAKVAAERLPDAIGSRISYSRYDGRTIDFKDKSFDRIMSYDAFHHVADQASTLAEMSRVLRDDGMAAFVEPGPHHSTAPDSQEEMRRHQVIENDIRIEEIWDHAKRSGFVDCKLWYFSLRPMARSLANFNAIENSDEEAALKEEFWHSSVRPIRRDLRVFTLYKGAPDEIGTSLRKAGLKADIAVLSAARSGEDLTFKLRVTNSGVATWLPSGSTPGAVNLGLMLASPDGRHDRNFRRIQFLKTRLLAGDSAIVEFKVRMDEIGDAQLQASMVAELVAWFDMLEGESRTSLTPF